MAIDKIHNQFKSRWAIKQCLNLHNQSKIKNRMSNKINKVINFKIMLKIKIWKIVPSQIRKDKINKTNLKYQK